MMHAQLQAEANKIALAKPLFLLADSAVKVVKRNTMSYHKSANTNAFQWDTILLMHRVILNLIALKTIEA